jgi:putative ABC transport system ATP-binding protein
MIQVQSLSKSYALQDINIHFQKESLSLIYGESGSGKSTLLSIIAAITKPTSGAVLVEGENIAAYNDFFASAYRAKKVGFITQEFHLFDTFTLEQNIAVALCLSNLSLDTIASRVRSIAERLHIEHKLQTPVANLSGGEKQRCIIARALVNEPDIILCDEPTANLDRENALRFIEILKTMKAMKKTIVVVTHDTLFENLEIVDARYRLKDGMIE